MTMQTSRAQRRQLERENANRSQVLEPVPREMTPAELGAFREAHGNQCGICADDRLVVIDHDHKTGRARGLLCPNCNSAIGKLRESPALLSAAAAYLEKHCG